MLCHEKPGSVFQALSLIRLQGHVSRQWGGVKRDNENLWVKPENQPFNTRLILDE